MPNPNPFPPDETLLKRKFAVLDASPAEATPEKSLKSLVSKNEKSAEKKSATPRKKPKKKGKSTGPVETQELSDTATDNSTAPSSPKSELPLYVIPDEVKTIPLRIGLEKAKVTALDSLKGLKAKRMRYLGDTLVHYPVWRVDTEFTQKTGYFLWTRYLYRKTSVYLCARSGKIIEFGPKGLVFDNPNPMKKPSFDHYGASLDLQTQRAKALTLPSNWMAEILDEEKIMNRFHEVFRNEGRSGGLVFLPLYKIDLGTIPGAAVNRICWVEAYSGGAIKIP